MNGRGRVGTFGLRPAGKKRRREGQRDRRSPEMRVHGPRTRSTRFFSRGQKLSRARSTKRRADSRINLRKPVDPRGGRFRRVLVHSDDKLRIALVSDVCVLRWFESPGVQQFDAVLRATQKPAERGRLALLNVADAHGKLPQLSTSEREAAKRMSVGLRYVTKAVAHVVLIDGFVGVAVRMIISTIVMARRSGSPNKIFHSFDEAQRWLTPYVANPKVAAQMEEIYQSLC